MDTDQSIQESLAGFDALWRRVRGADRPRDTTAEEAPAPGFQEEQTLQAFIREELCAAAFDSALARMLQGSGRTVLLAQAGEAKRRARRLQAEYFILTGLSCAPGNGGRPVSGKLASLRDAMLREERLSRRYARAAALTAVPGVQPLYTDYAAASAAHAQALRGLLIDAFA